MCVCVHVCATVYAYKCVFCVFLDENACEVCMCVRVCVCLHDCMCMYSCMSMYGCIYMPA